MESQGRLPPGQSKAPQSLPWRPHAWAGLQAPQPQAQMLEGDPPAEVVLSRAEARGHATKEEKLKSLLTAAKTANVDPSFANSAPADLNRQVLLQPRWV